MFSLSRYRHFLVPLKNQFFNLQDSLVQKEFHKAATPLFSISRNTRDFSSPASRSIVLENHESGLSKREEHALSEDTIKKVNEQVKSGNEGRLFAVVHICGKQFKITAEDIIIIEGYWPPHNGDEIKLEKVLMVGGLDFTLIGRPILPQNLLSVRATVIEKDLSHTKTIFYKKKRKQYQRINFYRSQFTMLRINEIVLTGTINDHKSIRQYERM